MLLDSFYNEVVEGLSLLTPAILHFSELRHFIQLIPPIPWPMTLRYILSASCLWEFHKNGPFTQLIDETSFV